MTTLYIAAAGLSGLTVLLLALGLAAMLGSRSKAGARLETYAATDAAPMPFDEGLDEPSGFAGRLNEYLGERSFAGATRASLARAGSKMTVAEYVIFKIAAALLPLAVLSLLGWFLPGLLLGGLCFFIPDVRLRRQERRRQRDFQQQLPDTLDMIVGGLRAGFSLQHSLANVAKQAPEPTAFEFNRVGQEMQLGVPLMEALDSLVRRIKSDDLEMIVSVFKIHSRVGGNLATVLETCSSTIRERVKLRREIQVITSMQRFSGYIIGALPIALGIVLFMINPHYMRQMFHWDVFLCIPVFAAIMMVFGFLVIRKLVDIKV